MNKIVSLLMMIFLLSDVSVLFAMGNRVPWQNGTQDSMMSVALNMPPGLLKKGVVPKGLVGKTPHGWSQGNKVGWSGAENGKKKRWHWQKSVHPNRAVPPAQVNPIIHPVIKPVNP